MDRSELLENIKADIKSAATTGFVMSVAHEYFNQKPEKDWKAILNVAKDDFIVSVASNTAADITECAVLKLQNEKTYGKRLFAKLTGSVVCTAAGFGVKCLMGKKQNPKDLIKDIPQKLAIDTLIFAFDNLEETAEVVKPVSKGLSDALLSLNKMMNPKSK